MQEQLKTILKDRFGFENFRKGQLEAICALLEQNRLLCIQPTGHGKSLLYQLPSVLLDGITLVISPLLALMRDQSMQLHKRFNITATSINSDQTEEENNNARFQAKKGAIKILFVAPEQLDNLTQFEFLLALPVSLIVVDEAHCISTWGHDFRPSYRKIVQLIHAMEKKNAQVKILGLTATANDKAEEDIKLQLASMNQPVLVHRETMNRPNIQLDVLQVYSTKTGFQVLAPIDPSSVEFQLGGKEQATGVYFPYMTVARDVANNAGNHNATGISGIAAKLLMVEQLVNQLKGNGLIYCATRENTELVAEYLQQKKINAIAYHAGFDAHVKKQLQHEFTNGKYKVIAATNALGMGIDKADLRFIIHFDVPGSITAYYQEVGRSGRDGLPANGILLFDATDKKIQQHFINSAQPTPEDFQTILQAIKNAEVAPKQTEIKRLVGLHPTMVIVVVAELLEQGYLQKVRQNGAQVYLLTDKKEAPDLERYKNQYQVKTRELQAMLNYGEQKNKCRMMILRQALGDQNAEECGHCDVCSNLSLPIEVDTKNVRQVRDWLAQRTVRTNSVWQHKISSGIAIFDGKLHAPLFIKFMRERTQNVNMDIELLALIKKQLALLAEQYQFGCVIPIPSKTWYLRDMFARFIAEQIQAYYSQTGFQVLAPIDSSSLGIQLGGKERAAGVCFPHMTAASDAANNAENQNAKGIPVFLDYLYWHAMPEARQGELLNNDQRRYNVNNKMTAKLQQKIPSGAILLLDDYTGSGATIKEAARVLRKKTYQKQAIVPLTIATIKWRLGERGMI